MLVKLEEGLQETEIINKLILLFIFCLHYIYIDYIYYYQKFKTRIREQRERERYIENRAFLCQDGVSRWVRSFLSCLGIWAGNAPKRQRQLDVSLEPVPGSFGLSRFRRQDVSDLLQTPQPGDFRRFLDQDQDFCFFCTLLYFPILEQGFWAISLGGLSGHFNRMECSFVTLVVLYEQFRLFSLFGMFLNE